MGVWVTLPIRPDTTTAETDCQHRVEPDPAEMPSGTAMTSFAGETVQGTCTVAETTARYRRANKPGHTSSDRLTAAEFGKLHRRRQCSSTTKTSAKKPRSEVLPTVCPPPRFR